MCTLPSDFCLKLQSLQAEVEGVMMEMRTWTGSVCSWKESKRKQKLLRNRFQKSITFWGLSVSKPHHKGFNVSVSFYCSGKIAFFKREDSSFGPFTQCSWVLLEDKLCVFWAIRQQALVPRCRRDETVFWSKVKGERKSIVGKCQQCRQNLLGKSR